MTVSSREHLSINTEKLLPGARSAALLWQGAALLGGAALGAGQVYGGAAPFGLALVIGCPPAYCVAAALGTLAAGLAGPVGLVGAALAVLFGLTDVSALGVAYLSGAVFSEDGVIRRNYRALSHHPFTIWQNGRRKAS